MDISQQSYDKLVSLLYETLEHNETWQHFYDALADAVDVEIVHMLGIDKSHAALSYSDGANMPANGELQYIQNYHFQDPRFPIILSSPLYHWVHCHEVLSEEFVAKDPFYQDFLIPHGVRYMSACKVVDDETATIVFSTLRRPEQGPLSPAAMQFLDSLVPHVSRVCRLSVKNFIYSTQALVGHALVNKLRQPVALTTVKGDIVHLNDAATQLVASSGLLSVQSGKLCFPQTYAATFAKECEALEATLMLNPDVAEPNMGAQFKTMRIQTAKSQDALYAFMTILVPQQIMGTFGLRPLIMIFFYHPDSSPMIDASLLTAAFGLSPAECKLAIMLAEGLTLKDIAENAGVKLDTVRKQLQSIFQKTATDLAPI